ncbi:hypothetical protein [Methylobacterium sp. WL103]|uniref:hypothetical protein n=1 Tax=Methylobacterium sp. WL103 TaxID=2603891 RepID=UPI001AED4635|nr:hypothetical protein [Methylobacterium sp. WL103]
MEGAQYVMVYAQGEDRQAPGNCLLRTTNPFDPSAWRAWDGTAFSVDMSTGAPCAPVGIGALHGEARSISLHKKCGCWITIFASRLRLPGDEAPIPGFYASESSDLKTWKPPVRIMQAPTRPREFQNEYFYVYPSLIDPDSKSLNFDTIEGDTARLFFTLHHLDKGKGTLDRDLVSVLVSIKLK